jgi:hypothetical protein
MEAKSNIARNPYFDFTKMVHEVFSIVNAMGSSQNVLGGN